MNIVSPHLYEELRNVKFFPCYRTVHWDVPGLATQPGRGDKLILYHYLMARQGPLSLSLSPSV